MTKKQIESLLIGTHLVHFSPNSYIKVRALLKIYATESGYRFYALSEEGERGKSICMELKEKIFKLVNPIFNHNIIAEYGYDCLEFVDTIYLH